MRRSRDMVSIIKKEIDKILKISDKEEDSFMGNALVTSIVERIALGMEN